MYFPFPPMFTRMVWFLAGLCLIGYGIGLSKTSYYLTFEAGPSQGAVEGLAAARILTGTAFLLVVFLIRKHLPKHGWLPWILGVGLVARLVLVPSVPVLENDYLRYPWDGAVLAAGVNPYAHAPLAALKALEDPNEEAAALRELAKEAGPVLEGINNPHLKTIYPPLAVGVFAAAHLLSPWNLLGWRILVLLFDAATLVLLLRLLRRLDLPLPFCLAYWWNPIVIHEFASSCRMDVLALPFVLAALLCAVRGKSLRASGFLVVGTGFMLWPAVLLPLVLRPLYRRPGLLVPALLSIGLLGAAILWPMAATGVQEDAGLLHYAKTCEANEALFRVVLKAADLVTRPIGFNENRANYAARWATGILYLLFLVWLARRPLSGSKDLCHRSLLALAVLFLVCPTPFPWYYTWFAPLLAVRPFFSLTGYALLLPLFQLTYRWPWLVWLEHLPVAFLLILEWRRSIEERP